MKKNKTIFIKEVILLSILILSWLTLVFIFLEKEEVLMWDEPVYLANSKSYLVETNFTEDFRFPALEYFIALIWLITGINIFFAQLLMISFSISAIIFFYLISRKLFDRIYLRIMATALFAFSSIFLFWSFRIYTDIPSLAFLLASIYFFFLYIERNFKFNESKIKVKNKLNYIISKFNTEKLNGTFFLFLSGIMTSLAFLMRFPSAISAIPITVFLIFKLRFKGFLFYSLGNLLILIPWMFWNYHVYSNPLWNLFAQAKVISLYTHFEPISIFLLNIYNAVNPFLLLFFFIFLILYFIDFFKIGNFNLNFSKNLFINFILILLIISLIYYSYGVGLKLERYILMILPFIIFLSVYAFLNLINIIEYQKKYSNLFKISIYFLLAILFFFHLSINVINTFEIMNERAQNFRESSFVESIEFVKSLPEGQVIISNSWVWYGFYGNHYVSAIWDNDINIVLHDNNFGYLILNEYFEGTNYDLIFNGELIKNITDHNNMSVLIYWVWK